MRIPELLLSEPVGVYAPALGAWLLRRERLEEFMKSPAGDKQLSISDFVNSRRAYQVTDQGVAIIHANEVLSRTATNVDKLLGDTHYNDLISELAQAAGDDQVRGILLDISSPGGSAVGAPEAAAAVQEASQKKPVVAYVETVGASAAYYFACASNAIIASPSAIVGSIGTISTFPDISAMLERFGVKFNIITPEQSDLKATGTPFRAMTDAEREFLQSRAESLNAAFTGWVQSHRPMVDGGAMRGQWFSGSQAADNGIVDQTGTRADALAALAALIAYPF